jgi:hypothetical protein
VSSWQLYHQSSLVDGAGNCTTPNNVWSQISGGYGPVSGGAFSNTGLTNGTCYQWALNSWSNAGNLNQVFTQLVMIDTSAPSVPSVPILAANSDTGSSHTDGLTAIANSLVFTGSADANSTIKLYAGGTRIAPATVSSGGGYSVTTTTALAGGVYTVTAQAADAAGNTSSASAGYAVVIHLTCPN